MDFTARSLRTTALRRSPRLSARRKMSADSASATRRAPTANRDAPGSPRLIGSVSKFAVQLTRLTVPGEGASHRNLGSGGARSGDWLFAGRTGERDSRTDQGLRRRHHDSGSKGRDGVQHPAFARLSSRNRAARLVSRFNCRRARDRSRRVLLRRSSRSCTGKVPLRHAHAEIYRR